MLINFKYKPFTLIMSSLVNFDKEGSKFEKKKCLCVCGGEGGGCGGALTPKLYAKLFFFFFFLIFFFFFFFFFCLFF